MRARLKHSLLVTGVSALVWGVGYPWQVHLVNRHRTKKGFITLIHKENTLRVQVPNNHMLTQNLYQNHYYPNPKYPIIRYMDPLG